MARFDQFRLVALFIYSFTWVNFVQGSPAQANVLGCITDRLEGHLAPAASGVITPKQGLLGKQNLSPRSPELRFWMSTIDGLRNFNDFPTIHPTEIVDSRALPDLGGIGNKEVREASYQGKKVFVKVMDPATRTESRALNEARMTMMLNKFGLGPEFKGIMRTESGDLAIVTELIDKAVAFKPQRPDALPENFVVKASHLQEIREAGQRLEAAGIRYTPDMQFMLTPDGHAVLIDCEYFAREIPANPPTDLPYDPVKNTEFIADRLREWARRHRGDAITEAPEKSSPAPRLILPGASPPPSPLLSRPVEIIFAPR